MTAIKLPAIGRTVGAAQTAAAEVPERPNSFTVYGSAVFAMTLLFLLGVGIPAAMAYGNAAGFGMGAFCAFWGGPGFGVMAGGARMSAWDEKYGAH